MRDATPVDAAACAAIYAHYVRDTTVTFEVEPPTTDEMRTRIERALEQHAWVVATDEQERVVGYAGAAPWKTRAAYRFSCETAIYTDGDRHERGTGRLLYDALLTRLERRGFRTVVAGVAQPNPASARLHAALGFTEVGTLRGIGHKHGRWLDVTMYQRGLGGASPSAAGPAAPSG